jgi:hypothetical protein
MTREYPRQMIAGHAAYGRHKSTTRNAEVTMVIAIAAIHMAFAALHGSHAMGSIRK